MPKRHVGLFFHVQTSNPADFNLLITDFAVQVVIFFNYIGGTFSGVPRIFERGSIRPQPNTLGRKIHSGGSKKRLQFKSDPDFMIFVSKT